MKPLYLIIILIFSRLNIFGQNIDSTQTPKFFKGQITATQNGVSLIPNFSLNKPAVMFDLSIGKGKLSFDPMIRFGMNGKPWAIIFWWRYKLIQKPKFNFGIGAHPSLVFRDQTIANQTGQYSDIIKVQRYFAWEAGPSYTVNKNLNFGLYYLGSHGLTKDVIQYTTFVALRSGINIPVAKKMTLNLIPQVYYLKMDKNDGMFTNLTTNIYHKKSPISLNGVISKTLSGTVPGKKFIWSVGLVYNINNKYLKIK